MRIFRKVGEWGLRIFDFCFIFVFVGSCLLAIVFIFLPPTCGDVGVKNLTSPSGNWTARIWTHDCGTAISAFETLHVGIKKTKLDISPFFWKRTHDVFVRDVSPYVDFPSGGEDAEVRWKDDNNLEIITVPCAPACYSNDKNDVKAEVKSCDLECRIISPVEGINALIVPPS